MKSDTTGVVRHCVSSAFPFGFRQPHASSGGASFHSTSIGCGAASLGAVRVPTFFSHTTSPRIEFSTTSGTLSPSQSATLNVV